MEQEKKITELFAKYVSYWNHHDLENWGKLFTENTKFITWSGVMYKDNAENIEQHRKAHQTLLAQNQHMTYHLSILNISLIRDDVALVYAAWDWKDFKIENSRTATRTGILTMLLLKENGIWLIRTTQNTRTS
ncbi:YybH family protein [Parapedobacter deserti]|uniref:YybH family protein n=1 Tax=Parapedobacter deserti TaxID=1912957 RepID=A0ABV7JL63_9SPHI